MHIVGASAEITTLPKDWGSGDEAAFSRLAARVYSELRQMARRYVKDHRQGNTRQAAAIVHEVYLRLVDLANVEWRHRPRTVRRDWDVAKAWRLRELGHSKEPAP